MTHKFHSFYYDQFKKEPVTDDFILPRGTLLTSDLLMQLIDEHREQHVPRYEYLAAAYETKYGIFGRNKKPDYKPDNRLAADMAFDITETFEGYFIGLPVDIKFEGDEKKAEYLREFITRNDQEDTDAELSKMASKFGNAYEMLYQDEEGRPCSAAIQPTSAFMIYDDSVLKRPMYFVTYMYDEEGRITGRYSDAEEVVKFRGDGGAIEYDAPEPHYFGDVPAIDFMQNSEKRGLYEGVLNLIEAYNNALSDKANDIDYFSDAYMVVEGMELDEKQINNMRENKLINLYGDAANLLKVYFLEKPDADTSQENLINRLEMLIFKMAMVPDITDDSFSTASGTALKMRLMPMNNLARNKERKFVKGIRRRLRMLANYPDEPFTGDDWNQVEIVMHRNMPEDLAAEASVAGSLSGIVSEETQLSVISCVDDPKKEIERKKAEIREKAESVTNAMPTKRTGSVDSKSMYKITSILDKRRRGAITHGNAVEMLKLIGFDEETAIKYLDDTDEAEGADNGSDDS